MVNDVFFLSITDENISRTFQKTDVRTSRDWVDNTWVDLKAKPDILSCIYKTVSPAVAGESECGGSAHLDHKVPSASGLEVVEDKPCCLVTTNGLLNNVNGANIGIGTLIISKDEKYKCGGDDDDNNAGKENKSVSEEIFESSNKKYEAAKTV